MIKKHSAQLLRWIYPTAFNVAFGFMASFLSLYYTANPTGCFTSCGWPLQFITQMPNGSFSIKFALNYGGLIVVWLFWYLLGCLIQGLYLSALKKLTPQRQKFFSGLALLIFIAVALFTLLYFHNVRQL